MTQEINTKQKSQISKYLIYAAIILLILNFILIFLPFVKTYQPTQSKTNIFGETTYEGWHTTHVPAALTGISIFTTAIPYLCSIIALIISLIRKRNKSAFFKILNDDLKKPIRFFWLKFASIVNLIIIIYLFTETYVSMAIAEYWEYGAYCKLTFFGVLNIICSLAFVISLIIITRKTKSMFVYVNTSQIATKEEARENQNNTFDQGE